jgi:hypothetical protein
MDEEADRRPRLRVASIACGYLREANLSRAFADGRIARFTCLDQDPESTRDIAFRYEGNTAVVPVRASIARLIDRSFALGEHDLIYSAGLYDYLRRLVAHLPLRLRAAEHARRRARRGDRERARRNLRDRLRPLPGHPQAASMTRVLGPTSA